MNFNINIRKYNRRLKYNIPIKLCGLFIIVYLICEIISVIASNLITFVKIGTFLFVTIFLIYKFSDMVGNLAHKNISFT